MMKHISSLPIQFPKHVGSILMTNCWFWGWRRQGREQAQDRFTLNTIDKTTIDKMSKIQTSCSGLRGSSYLGVNTAPNSTLQISLSFLWFFLTCVMNNTAKVTCNMKEGCSSRRVKAMCNKLQHVATCYMRQVSIWLFPLRLMLIQLLLMHHQDNMQEKGVR